MSPEEKIAFAKLQKDVTDLVRRHELHKHLGQTEGTQKLASGSTVYAGSIKSDGTVNFIPSGWSSVRNSNGNYTITHNLGTTTYAVAVSVSDDVLNDIVAGSATTTSFDVRTFTYVGATPNDRAFFFTVTLG